MNGMPMKQGQSCTGLNKMEWIRTDSNWSSRGWLGVGKFVSGRALFEIHARRDALGPQAPDGLALVHPPTLPQHQYSQSKCLILSILFHISAIW